MPQLNDLGVDVWHHFTSLYPSWQVAGQTDIEFCQEQLSLGVKGLCWQAQCYLNGNRRAGVIPAAVMSAQFYDSRVRWAPGLVSAFELLATAQLYGDASELVGRRYSWEMICATRASDKVPAVAGGCNGVGSYSDGTPLIR